MKDNKGEEDDKTTINKSKISYIGEQPLIHNRKKNMKKSKKLMN